MEELKKELFEIREDIERQVFICSPRNKMYYIGQMNLLNEVLDIIDEIETR